MAPLSLRVQSPTGGIGARIEAGQIGFKQLEAYVLEHGEPARLSGKQERLENVLNPYLV